MPKVNDLFLIEIGNIEMLASEYSLWICKLFINKITLNNDKRAGYSLWA